MLSFISPAAKAEEILIACEYENKVFMSIVDTSRSGLQRVFGHNAYVTQHKAGFLRISIQMDVESRDIIFSERSGAMSYNSGEIDQNVSCRLEELTNAAMNVPEEMPDQGKHDYLWYFNQHGIEMSYTTDEP